MAVSIEELIARKEEIEKKKEERYDLKTSIGTITVKKPVKAFVAEGLNLETGSDEYMLYNLCVAPSLKDPALQKAYGCVEPTDIVDKLFEPGEVVAIVKAVMTKAGYGENIEAVIHEEVKN